MIMTYTSLSDGSLSLAWTAPMHAQAGSRSGRNSEKKYVQEGGKRKEDLLDLWDEPVRQLFHV